MIKKEKMAFYILSSMLMGIILIFLPEIADNTVPTYLLILGAYVGIDVGVILKQTNSLPSGEYKEVKRSVYFISIFFTFALFITALVMAKGFNAPVTGSLSILSMSIFFVISAYLGVLQGNKLLTGLPPVKSNKSEK